MLQGIFDFQCMMDGADVRYWKALLAPMLPLIFLIVCSFFELVKRGSGCLIAEFLEKSKKRDSSHPAYNLRCLIEPNCKGCFTGSLIEMKLRS